LGPKGSQTHPKSTPKDPDQTSDNLKLRPHELYPHPQIADQWTDPYGDKPSAKAAPVPGGPGIRYVWVPGIPGVFATWKNEKASTDKCASIVTGFLAHSQNTIHK
jgi:hypothetical protein